MPAVYVNKIYACFGFLKVLRHENHVDLLSVQIFFQTKEKQYKAIRGFKAVRAISQNKRETPSIGVHLHHTSHI